MVISVEATNSVFQALARLMASKDQCFSFEDIIEAAQATCKEPLKVDEVKKLVDALFEQQFMQGFTKASKAVMDEDTRRIVDLFVPPNGDPSSYTLKKVISASTAVCEPRCDNCACEPEPTKESPHLRGYGTVGVAGATSVMLLDYPSKPLIGLTGLMLLDTPAPTPTPAPAPAPKLPPAPESNKPVASPEQQAEYLKKWNKSPSAGKDEAGSLLDHLRNRVSNKLQELKDLLS